MKSRLAILWIIWTLLSTLLIVGVSMSESDGSPLTIIAHTLSLAPLMGLMLALGSTRAAARMNAWLAENNPSAYYLGGGLIVLYTLPGLITWNFNPYNTVIFSVTVLAVFGVLKHFRQAPFALNWSDIALWMLLWIPFDLRWWMKINAAIEDISYVWWSVAVSVIAILGWHGFRGAAIGYDLVPKARDFRVSLLALLGIMVLVVPPGLLTGFLTFSWPEAFDVSERTLHFVGLFLTVALPEELFFRGILLRGLDGVFEKKWIPMAISSVAFGLMHWNNIEPVSMQITYCTLATVAGIGYGWAYRKSGNNLLAAILTHTLVDWVWKLVFAG